MSISQRSLADPKEAAATGRFRKGCSPTLELTGGGTAAAYATSSPPGLSGGEAVRLEGLACMVPQLCPPARGRRHRKETHSIYDGVRQDTDPKVAREHK